jgi:hypothetical protein
LESDNVLAAFQEIPDRMIDGQQLGRFITLLEILNHGLTASCKDTIII